MSLLSELSAARKHIKIIDSTIMGLRKGRLQELQTIKGLHDVQINIRSPREESLSDASRRTLYHQANINRTEQGGGLPWLRRTKLRDEPGSSITQKIDESHDEYFQRLKGFLSTLA